MLIRADGCRQLREHIVRAAIEKDYGFPFTRFPILILDQQGASYPERSACQRLNRAHLFRSQCQVATS